MFHLKTEKLCEYCAAFLVNLVSCPHLNQLLLLSVFVFPPSFLNGSFPKVFCPSNFAWAIITCLLQLLLLLLLQLQREASTACFYINVDIINDHYVKSCITIEVNLCMLNLRRMLGVHLLLQHQEDTFKIRIDMTAVCCILLPVVSLLGAEHLGGAPVQLVQQSLRGVRPASQPPAARHGPGPAAESVMFSAANGPPAAIHDDDHGEGPY